MSKTGKWNEMSFKVFKVLSPFQLKSFHNSMKLTHGENLTGILLLQRCMNNEQE